MLPSTNWTVSEDRSEHAEYPITAKHSNLLSRSWKHYRPVWWTIRADSAGDVPDMGRSVGAVGKLSSACGLSN